MKVVCKRNRETPEGDPNEPGGAPRVTVGNEYLVYAVAWDSCGKLTYYLCDDLYSYYPYPHQGEWFVVTDGRLPASWVIACTAREAEWSIELCDAVWANDRYFFDCVTDAEPVQTNQWYRIKEAIDAEFADPE